VTGPASKTYVPSITYKPASIPNTLALGNGLTETYAWNDRLQLTGLNAGNALALSIYPCDQGATSCPAGNTGGTWRETITTNGALNAVQEFRHDSLNRLLTASEKTAAFTAPPSCPDSGSVWCRQFGYDAPGNRTIAGRSPNGSESWDVSSISSATNKILDVGWSYDAAGNIIGANNAGTSVALQYDAEDRQVAYCYTYTANCVNTPGTGVTVYYYDGEGQRVEQIDPTTGTTVFVYDAFGELVAGLRGLGDALFRDGICDGGRCGDDAAGDGQPGERTGAPRFRALRA
jgi:YD repeat-containing protein